MMVLGTCKLCEKENIAMAKCHVIPRALYGKSLKDPLGPAKLITNTPGHYPKKTRIGIYDSGIVCQACEQRFGPWDDYANTLLLRSDPDEVLEKGDQRGAYIYKKPDYKRLKLFFMSMLWRAHHSTQDFFKGVQLKTKLEKKLRALVRMGQPGTRETFAVFLARFDDSMAEAFMHPFHERYEGVGVYRFFFSMHVAYIKVTNQPLPQTFRPMALAPDRDLVILAREFRGSKELAAFRQLMAAQQD